MARYYLLTEFTPSYVPQGRVLHRRVFSCAPQGFLFHDTAPELHLRTILRPLRALAQLCGSVHKALVLRVDAQTLVATFSLAGFPYPVQVNLPAPYESSDESFEWLNKNPLRGWLIPDVHNPHLAPIPCVPGDYYDACTELSKFTGGCPCPLLKAGVCQEKYLVPNLPAGFDLHDLITDFTIPESSLKRVKYRRLNAFEYITGTYTQEEEFAEALRPWDAHTFSSVEVQRTKYAKRGAVNSFRAAFRKAQCATCCFMQPRYGKPDECGASGGCEGATNEASAWGLLYQWYRQSGFDNTPGFTNAERDYLIEAAGRSSLAKGICSRRTQTLYGGFVYTNQTWSYRLSADAGNPQRTIDIPSWGRLKTILPELPDTLPATTLQSQDRLACAILGRRWCVTETQRRSFPIHSIQVTPLCISAYGASTSDATSVSATLQRGSHATVLNYYCERWGHSYYRAPAWIKSGSFPR